MKNFARVVVVLSLLLGSVYATEDDIGQTQRGSLFIGAELGYAASMQASTGTASTNEFRIPFGVAGLKLGYVDYFGGSVGLRSYGSYHYLTDNEQYGYQLAFNTEVIWNVGTKLSVYLGLGLGYAKNGELSITANTANAQVTDTTKGSGMILPANVGFEVRLDNHHSVGLNIRAGTITTNDKLTQASQTNNNNSNTSRNFLLTFGYNYRF